MTEVVSSKSQEEYEDDFEKDLDWLISEEGRSEEQVTCCLFCFSLKKTNKHLFYFQWWIHSIL